MKKAENKPQETKGKVIRKAIYTNPKTGKFYAIIDRADGTGADLYTVYDNAEVLGSAEIKVDKKGRAYKVASVRARKTKAGYVVLETVVPEPKEAVIEDGDDLPF